ncbi:MAG: DNA repair protein RecN, partial [Clostridiales bacterium]|nr:DNA repair protein RecN [Clostridiales bacterium]
AKADKTMIRYGAEECFVRAEFRIGDNDKLREVLKELDLEGDDLLIITRKFGLDGKGSSKINGCTVTSSMLRRVTSRLVDVHGQSEHFFLLKENHQLALIDEMAGEKLIAEKDKLKELLLRRRQINENLSLLGGDEGERSRRLDVLKYQIDEISHAALKENEEEELKARRELLAHAEKILELLSTAREYLTADGSGLDALNGAHRALSALSRFGDNYNALADRSESAVAELNDVAETVEDLSGELDLDPREADRVENRLDQIKLLKKKYGGSIPDIFAFSERAKEEYELLSTSGERMEELKAELEEVDGKIYAVCTAMTKIRRAAAEAFAKRVTAELKTLNIASARFEVQFTPYARESVPQATADGLDKLCFLFSANAGEPLKELGKIASGGEMSRFMLAVKTQLRALYGIGTYVFDEIDAGISGVTARVVGEKFVKISRDTQVIAVSHLAQIAAFADAQFYIEKSEKGGKTFTHIRAVEGDARTQEIARLVGGETGDLALNHAAKLLENAKVYKKSL